MVHMWPRYTKFHLGITPSLTAIVQVRSFIERNSSVDIGEEGCASLQAGLIEASVRISTWHGFSGLWGVSLAHVEQSGIVVLIW